MLITLLGSSYPLKYYTMHLLIILITQYHVQIHAASIPLIAKKDIKGKQSIVARYTTPIPSRLSFQSHQMAF